MKWVKVAIGAVIAIMSIGIVATSVYNMTQETTRERVVTFEVLTETTVTSGTFLKINEYVILGNNDYATNILNITLNGTSDDFTDGRVQFVNNLYYIGDDADDIPSIEVTSSDIIGGAGYNIGDTFEITFEVSEAQLSGISATLILLAPLIFAGGVLAYLLNKQNY